MKKRPVTICHLCRRKADEEEHFCYGCKVHICEKCDFNLCVGKHVPADHIRQMPGEYHGE
jgi:hypothetical protein